MGPSRQLASFLGRFHRAQGGATVVEYAMLALPFSALMLGILELGMIMLISSTLDGAVFQAARMVRTGQVTNLTDTSPAKLKTSICNQLSWLGSSCASNLNVDVRSFTSFTNVAAPNSANGTKSAKMCWDTGGPGSVVLVTAYYPWTLYAPLIDAAMVNLGSTQHLMVSTAVFKTEPYDTTTSAPKACPP